MKQRFGNLWQRITQVGIFFVKEEYQKIIQTMRRVKLLIMVLHMIFQLTIVRL